MSCDPARPAFLSAPIPPPAAPATADTLANVPTADMLAVVFSRLADEQGVSLPPHSLDELRLQFENQVSEIARQTLAPFAQPKPATMAELLSRLATEELIAAGGGRLSPRSFNERRLLLEARIQEAAQQILAYRGVPPTSTPSQSGSENSSLVPLQSERQSLRGDSKSGSGSHASTHSGPSLNPPTQDLEIP